MAKDNLHITPAVNYAGELTKTMKIDQLENKLKTLHPSWSWDERLTEARRILK